MDADPRQNFIDMLTGKDDLFFLTITPTAVEAMTQRETEPASQVEEGEDINLLALLSTPIHVQIHGGRTAIVCLIR